MTGTGSGPAIVYATEASGSQQAEASDAVDLVESSSGDGGTASPTNTVAFEDSSGEPSGHRNQPKISPADQKENAKSLSQLSVKTIKACHQAAGEENYEKETVAVGAARTVVMLSAFEVDATFTYHGTTTSVEVVDRVRTLKADGWSVLVVAHFHPSGISRPSGGGKFSLGSEKDEGTYRQIKAVVRGDFESYVVTRFEVGLFTNREYTQRWTRMDLLP
jgi:hypothetical protein